MQCPNCGFENPAGIKFCGECGSSLQRVCPECKVENPPGFKFCGDCGAPLTRIAKPKTIETPAEAERRQLTVMFCDLVGSTELSGKLDPEVLREVLHDYQSTCARTIRRFEGYIARYFGDGILVYFGYPVAHEDDARRAIHTGLGIVEAIAQLNNHLERDKGLRLQVRLGIHTGIVVAGDIGEDQQLESMAIIGETPNIAARLEGMAEPDTVVISPATYKLVGGLFDMRELGTRTLKGVPRPMRIYQVLGDRDEELRFSRPEQARLTPLVGREQDVNTLLKRWERARAGSGQVVLISGEAGIGKSRLVHVVKTQLADELHVRQEYRCSPYHQNSALYPVIDLLERWLGFEREGSPQNKLEILEAALAEYSFIRSDGTMLPLLASLLSIPLDERYPPLNLTPQRQRERTLECLLYLLLETATQQPLLVIFEDLHWADPSILELLNLIIDQAPTSPLLVLVTFRPTFSPPWNTRSYISQVTLGNLPVEQTKAIVSNITGGKTLPDEILAQLVTRTDGVPLFVEELTKMVLESGLLREGVDRYELTGPLPPLAIPTTLRDSLTARLDRLATVKEVAQLGATLGREFRYELLQAISLLDEETLQGELARLVAAELLYQRGLPPQVKYIFKHALIQEAAYRSMLRSKRRQVHEQVARILEEKFPETAESQPELLAHHYTEAGLNEQAISYWQRAGERAGQRSANLEAINHLKKGLALLETLPDTPERIQQELTLLVALGNALIATRGYASLEVKQTYNRARHLCQQVGETPQLFPVLYGLWAFYLVQGTDFQTARELGEEFLDLAQRQLDPSIVVAYRTITLSSFILGEHTSARRHAEEIVSVYNREQHHALAFLYGGDPGAAGLAVGAWAIWLLGYPDQALDWAQKGVSLARQVSHPLTLAYALTFSAKSHQFCWERQEAQEQAEEAIALCEEHGFALWSAWATSVHGWALAGQGQVDEGINEIRRGMVASHATGSEIFYPYFLALQAEVYCKAGQIEGGLNTLAEALEMVEKNENRYWEAEMYRLKGELLLLQDDSEADAEANFQEAIKIAAHQEAKSLELRATVSLSRLREMQGKKEEARRMLAEIYEWFTEGFDTVDLKEARALLEALSDD